MGSHLPKFTALGRYEPLSFDVWLVKFSIADQSNANDWSGRMQTHGKCAAILKLSQFGYSSVSMH